MAKMNLKQLKDGDSTSNVNLGDGNITRPVLKDYGMTTTTLTGQSGTVDLNLELGNVFDITMSGETMFTFSNPPASGTYGKIILILRGAQTVIWPSTDALIIWPDGIEPTHTTPATYAFVTVDGGVTWFGMQAGKAFASV